MLLNQFSSTRLPQIGLERLTATNNRTWVVTLDEARLHLRVTHNLDDDYITRLIRASQILCEGICNGDFTSCDWVFQCDTWEQIYNIPYSGMNNITSIVYKDTTGASITWAASNYYIGGVSIQPNRIAIEDNTSYPDLYNGLGGILVKFTTRPMWSKYSLMSELAAQAVLITVSDLYENRQSVIVGRIASSIPKTADYLLSQLKYQVL